MKKLNKLFAILFAVLGVTTLKAQTWTDVTSTYIKNPTLIADYYSSNNNSAWPVYTTGRGTSQHPKNWILHTYGTKNHNIGGAFFEAWNSSSTTLRWTLFQDVTLPAGKYKLTGRYSTDQSRGIIKTAAITPHHSYYSPGITSSNWGSWGAETAEFTIYEETPVRVGMISINFAQCNGFTLETSGAKQLLADEIAAAPEILSDAIAVAQDVYDNVSSDDAAYRSAAKELHNAVIVHNIENASVEKPVDMTNHIANPSFEGVGGSTSYTENKHACSEWTYTNNSDAGARSATGSDYLNTDDSNDAFYCFNTWGGSAFEVTQTLTDMPAGRYKLTASYASDANNVATLYINSKENGVTLTATGKGHFVNGSFIYDLAVDGELIIGMTSNKWYKADDFKLSYLGDPAKAAKDLLANTLAEANKIEESTVSNAVWTMLQSAISNGNSAVELSAIEEATAELQTAINCADVIKEPFANFKLFSATCENILNNSQQFVDDAKTTFSTAISTTKTDVEEATTADAINNNYNILEAARQTYVQQADPTNGTVFDYTFKVTNPEFNNGTTGWTSNTSAYSNTIATNQGGAITGNYYENWNESSYVGAISQTIKGLPTGKYELTAAAFRDQLIKDADADAVYVFANDGKTLVNSATPEFYSVMASSGDGNLKIGIKSEDKVYKWMGIDNVSLKYHGFDAEVAQTGLNNLIAEAQALLDKPMNLEIASALNAAIDNADVTKTNRNELNLMIETLEEAVSDAKVSVAAYEAIDSYINKANTIDESIALNYQSQYENRTLSESAETIFQALELATYSYVTTEFSYPVELSGEWTTEGPVGEMSDQHWSGEKRTYMEQSSAAWGWDAWSISYDQDLTLPAGEYVFKVAGRKAAGDGCTLELIVTKEGTTLGTVNDFPEGDTGRGIETNGTANFSEEGTYVDVIKDGQIVQANGGRGWQWRYVKFTLDSEATVNIAVKAEATTNHQWISFCDATVQMTEETYLAANMHGLDAPTAAAEALVGTKPMGTAANQALKDALNMSVNTGAELLAKIEALNTAVANANAWVAEYNNAKVQLVEALERFEADYNDAENGALNHMNKNRWATAIEKAQAAAEAKDVTNSYEGFATAANNLIAALDAATTSIDEYAALNEAIGQAEVLAGANVGDQPFQRSQDAINGLGITDAKNAYTTATVDGEGVTSVTETLKAAINGIVLNAPAEGQRFNMVMSYAGWEYDGKAVTYLAGGRTDAGLYNIQYYAAPNANYAQAFTFTAVEGQPDCYTLSMTDVDGNERYVCAGTIYGGNTSQLRTTTDASQALAVKVIATATEGVWNLYNTAANNYIGGTDAGFYTTNSHTTFHLQEAQKAEVTLAITDAEWSTLMLPFDTELPEGVEAYSCKEIAEDGVTLTLVEAESLKANTPYLVNGEAGEHEFAGYGLATKDSYTSGLFTGTYVEYQTTANGNTYVLQKNDNNVAFYLVGEDVQPWVRAYHCYMTYDKAAGAPMFSISRGEDATGIENSTLNAQPSTVIYDLMGRRVTTMVKGNMYIVNGKKVVIK